MLKHTTLLAAAVSLALLPATAFAAPPSPVLLQGAMTSQGGGPAADGKYNFTFAIYAAEFGGASLWKEGPVGVQATGGRFGWVLGSKAPLDATALAANKALFLGVKIGSDPELPRTRIHATAFALHAGTAGKVACKGCVGADQIANGGISALKVNFAYAAAANGIKGGDAKAARALNCTGCVSVNHLKFDKTVDLAGHALVAGKLTSQGDIQAGGTVAAKQFLGDGSKLTGIKLPQGDCPKGQAIAGIDAAGKLKCAAATSRTSPARR